MSVTSLFSILLYCIYPCHMKCDPDGRPESEQQLLFINPDVSVEQIGDDPILMLENVTYVADCIFIVTQTYTVEPLSGVYYCTCVNCLSATLV